MSCRMTVERSLASPAELAAEGFGHPIPFPLRPDQARRRRSQNAVIGAKKQRRVPFGRWQRQYCPSTLGSASLYGTTSAAPFSSKPALPGFTEEAGTTKQSCAPQHHSPFSGPRKPPREIQLSWANAVDVRRESAIAPRRVREVRPII